MSTTLAGQPALTRGDFIRVAKDAEFRPGQDGMVWSPPDENGDLGLIFGYDRCNEASSRSSEGPEAWNLKELDLTTIEH